MKRLVLALSLVFLVTGCTKKPADAPSASAPPPARTLNLAIWSNYISPEVMADFEKTTGIKVQQSNYSSNEELLAKLQAGASGYDVAVPSDYMVFAMIKLGLLEPLDYSQIASAKTIDPKFTKKSYDPENKYSTAYNTGTTGIAVNRDLYKGELRGWKDLFEKPELAGKFTLLDDAREVIGAALKANGASLNSRKPEDLAKAKALLLKVRSRVKAFTSEPMLPLVNGETAVAHAFLPDALKARSKLGGKIDYVIPVEGGTLWIDSLVIPKGAQHLKEAHEFIDFMLKPKTLAITSQAIWVAPANAEAYSLLPASFRENPAIFPPASATGKLEMMEDVGETLTAYDRVWTEIKAEQ